jgi:lipoprotein Spr
MSGVDGVVARARALVGAPFRLHGRCAALGVDCVGLAMLALGRDGAPGSYGLRMGDARRAVVWLAAAGLRRVDDARPGDLALVRAGPMQLHLMIHVPGGFVHAHAGLRRVVEMPGPSQWPVIGCWRL